MLTKKKPNEKHNMKLFAKNLLNKRDAQFVVDILAVQNLPFEIIEMVESFDDDGDRFVNYVIKVKRKRYKIETIQVDGQLKVTAYYRVRRRRTSYWERWR